MKTVTVLQKPVTINNNNYVLNFVQVAGKDLEVIATTDTDSTFQVVLSDTDSPVEEWENEVIISIPMLDLLDMIAKEEAFKGWTPDRAWNELTLFEKLVRLQPLLTKHFNSESA